MNVIAIIQARLGSTRLPRKVLLDLQGKTVLERVIERVSAASRVDKVVVATTGNVADTEIVDLCTRRSISVYAGSEDDVLDRYYQAALLFKADHYVRITADCPLMDPKVIDAVIAFHIKENADYSSNTLKETYPDGEDVEVFTFSSLEKAWNTAKLLSEREHVTPYIRKNPSLFKQANVACDRDLSKKRWTLDQSEDYAFIRTIYDSLCATDPLFGMDAILGFIEKDPSVEKVNWDIGRNEGYQKSLEKDKEVT